MTRRVALNGTIAAAAAGVTDAAANILGAYEGDAAVNITTERVIWRGQSLVNIESVITSLGGTMNVGRIELNVAKVFGTLWGVTATAGSTAETTPTTASIYNFDASVITDIPRLQVLSTVERHDTKYKFQVKAYEAQLAASFPLSLKPRDVIVEDLSWMLYAEASTENLLDFIWEN